MELKKSVVSWNFCAMSKQVSPLSTPTTASHSGVDLALVPIAHSKINTKKCQFFIKQTQHYDVALQKFFQTVNAAIVMENSSVLSMRV